MVKKVEGQQDLGLDFEDIMNENNNNKADAGMESKVPPAIFVPVVTCKEHCKEPLPLSTSETPSVTLHKGGGKIVITPNDLMAAIALLEIRERIASLSHPIIVYSTHEELKMQLLPDVTPDDFERATRVWSLVGQDIDKHPMGRLLNRYGLKVELSPSLSNWLKKEERRLKRELTPFLLPDLKDERSLFEKVEAGMVLNCNKDFKVDNATIFHKGERYQVIDTARSGGGGDDEKEHEDGVVKISKTAVNPNAKITMAEDTVFAWTIFNGDLENNFDYAEKLIYDPEKCMPQQYPELLGVYQSRLEKLGLELYDHVKVDVVQEAIKRSTLNGKLMRMGKTSESIVCALLWGSERVAVVAPRNARLFTVKEFERLGIKDYIVVNEMSDFQKPAKFYLMTYSWLKKSSDKHRKLRRKGQSFLHRTYKDHQIDPKTSKPISGKGVDTFVQHKCPFCERTLERLVVDKKKSIETGFVLTKTVSWTKERGYICLNKNCKAEAAFKTKGGAKGGAPVKAVWGKTIDPLTGKITIAKPIKLGSDSPIWLGPKPGDPNAEPHSSGEHIGYINWALKFHKDCDDKFIKGRYCHTCKQADAVWIPAPYKQKVLKANGKKVHLKDYFTGAIIDEIHTIKSADSDTGKAIRAIRAKRRMGLTGTLMPNTPADSFWPLHWVFKGGSAQFPYHQKDGATQFYNAFCEYVTVKRGKKLADSRRMLPYLKNPIQFWELMSSKMVRRNYEDELVKSSLAKANRFYPDIEFHRVESIMDPKQAQFMVAAINHFEQDFNAYADQVAQKGHLLNQAMIVGQMVYLRIGATCPEYFNVKLAKKGQPPIYDGPNGGGKMSDIQNICATKTAAGEKVVVLTDFVEMRKSLAIALKEHDPIVFDGTWEDEERNENFEAFLVDPTRKVFIAGTRQIREGTNLSSANTVICCDLLWEPGLQQQAWSRAFTPTSEKRTCNVYMLMAKNSIDEHVYSTFYAKVAAAEQALDRKVINKRAHQVDLRWFVERVLSDRDGILAYLKEEGEKGVYVSEKVFQVIEDRET